LPPLSDLEQVQRDSSTPSSHEVSIVAVAWWAAFFATLALIALLGLARSAQALTVSAPAGLGPVTTLAAVAEEEEGEEKGDEEEAGAEASEDDEAEADGCEADEEEADEEECDESGGAPEECELSSAEATVFASPNHDNVRLQVRYSTSAPTAVSLDYGLHGAKGSLYLGATKKKLGREGVLHLSKSLTEAQMAKVMAAKGFTVRLRVADVPGYCQAFFDQQLDVRRATPSGLTWLQSE
jgi:hypothetical protein